MRTPSSDELVAAGMKTATMTDGRRVAWKDYGETSQSAPVVINIHGSGLEAGFEETVHAKACQDLGVRGLAISLPGCGYSDQKPGRIVKDWPMEDLAAVLEAENIDRFFITGHSQGTPHAMAAAMAYPERCIGLGLNAPLLPSALVNELKLGKTIGTGFTPTSSTLKSFWMGWYFGMMHLVLGVFPPSWIAGFITKGLPKVQADKELQSRFHASMKRSVVRGACGGVWETAQDTCFEWGIDITQLQHTNACVWHADDDTAIPAFQGKWLAQHLNADYRHEAEGYGHMTYTVGLYRTAESSMIKQLMNGADEQLSI